MSEHTPTSESDARGKIITDYWAKPIPLRQFDWSAVRDNYEPPMPIGYGATEEAAIADLLMLEEE